MSPEPTPLPLAAAALRLRGKPGRPRTRPRPEGSTPPPRGYALPATPPKPRPREPDAPETRPILGAIPRLLGVREAAHYLGISEWSVREWIASGALSWVAIALPTTTKRRGGECRRVLVDRYDLDALIERSKAREKGTQ